MTKKTAKKTTKKTTQKTSSSRQIPVSVGIALALLILGLYLLQVTGILDLGLFDALEQALSTATAEVLATPTGGANTPREIQVYFTTPQYPDKKANHHGGIDEVLAADIAQARASVDVAAYEFNLDSLTQALLDAHERGVQVRLVTDTDNVDERQVRKLRRAGIPIVEDDQGAIMHNKFVIIDQHIVWTGSWNLTDNGTYRNNNNAMRITSATLAQNYMAEFDEMFVDHAFGPTSPADTPHPKLKLTSASTGKTIQMENYFAPEDQVAAKILARVQDAQESIRFLAFSFTDDQLGETIKQKSKDGLTVQGVFETRGSDTEYSEYELLRRARPPLDVLTDGNPYVMHHKVIILDGRIVILGSFNFSENADQSNDENILIIYDADIATLYEAEFQRVYDQAAAAGN